VVKAWRRTETGRGAPRARRDDREYRQYLKEEQRSPRRGPRRGSRVGVGWGCIARRMQPDFHDGLLSVTPLNPKVLRALSPRRSYSRAGGFPDSCLQADTLRACSYMVYSGGVRSVVAGSVEGRMTTTGLNRPHGCGPAPGRRVGRLFDRA